MSLEINKMLAEQYVAKDVLLELIADFAIKLDGEGNESERDFLKGCLKTYKTLKRDVDAFNKPIIEFVIEAYARNNNGGKITMERLKIAHRLEKVLEKEGVPNSRMVAEYWVEQQKERLEFFDDVDKSTLEFIKSKVEIEKIEDSLSFASAFINGQANIEEVYNYLMKFYSEEELKKYYQKNFQAFSFEIEDVKSVVDYLESLKLTQEQMKGMVLEALNVGLEECKLRNELVLKLFGYDKDFLVFLATERSLYYPHYYVDVPEAINYIVDELGAEKARTLLEENELFFILYRRKEYRLQYSSLFGEAMGIIEKYK